MVLVYVGFGALVLTYSSENALATLAVTYPLIVGGNAALIASVAGIWTIGFLARNRPLHPFSAVGRAFGQPDVWPVAVARATILLPATALVTGTFSAIKSEIPNLQAFVFDDAFVALDAALHGGIQPWVLLQPFVGFPLITLVLDQVYYLWFPILYHTYYWQMFTKRQPVLRLQFLSAFLLSWMLIGSAAAVALSSAGPVFLVDLGLDGSAFTGLFDYLSSVNAGSEIFAMTVQEMLWVAYSQGIAMPFEGITAMPSMHVTIAFLLMLFGWRRHWILGVSSTVFALMIFVGSIHLGFHYAVDGYVAALMVAAIWWISGKIVRRNFKPSPTTQT